MPFCFPFAPEKEDEVLSNACNVRIEASAWERTEPSCACASGTGNEGFAAFDGAGELAEFTAVSIA
jgi:hypothetical protein